MNPWKNPKCPGEMSSVVFRLERNVRKLAVYNAPSKKTPKQKKSDFDIIPSQDTQGLTDNCGLSTKLSSYLLPYICKSQYTVHIANSLCCFCSGSISIGFSMTISWQTDCCQRDEGQLQQAWTKAISYGELLFSWAMLPPYSCPFLSRSFPNIALSIQYLSYTVLS